MKKLSSEDKIGIYITVIIHLTVIIILFITQIGQSLNFKESFLIDFSNDEEIERKEKPKEEEPKEESFDEAISRRIDELISGESNINFKNVAVNRSSTLKDDRGTDAQKLYDDANKLAQDLKNGFQVDEDDDNYVATSKPKNKENKEAKEYSGPSVVSYQLDGRKASYLPIPAYRCYGGGMVTVLITVNNAGKVINAKIQDETSTGDKCLREFAIRAARMSRFSSSSTAPARQGGNIVYQFIAQ